MNLKHNSYYWDYYNENENGKNDELLKEIYAQISILSSLSQIEIDRAKKDYTLETANCLIDVREYCFKCNGEPLLKYEEKSFDKRMISEDEEDELVILNIALTNAQFYKNNEEAINELEQQREDFLDSLKPFTGIDEKYKEPMRFKITDEHEYSREEFEKVEQELKEFLKIKALLESFDYFTEKDEKYYELICQLYEALYYNYDEEALTKILQEIKDLFDSGVPHLQEVEELFSIECELNEARFCKDNEALESNIQKEMDNFYVAGKRDVQVRPYFLQYCNEVETDCWFVFKKFKTPMDYLLEVLKKIPEKGKVTSVDIADIIPEPNFSIVDRKRMNSILEDCKTKNSYINILQSKNYMRDEIKNILVRNAKEKLTERLRNLGVDENLIRVVIYRAYSDKKIKFSKADVEEYRAMRRFLVSSLCLSHEKEFAQVLEKVKEAAQK